LKQVEVGKFSGLGVYLYWFRALVSLKGLFKKLNNSILLGFIGVFFGSEEMELGKESGANIVA